MTDYKSYKSGGGRLGFGVAGGAGAIEYELFKNRVDGCFIQPSTTGSTQITGTGNGTYLYNITAGIIYIDGKALQVNGAVDQACQAAANIMVSTYAKYYIFIAYLSSLGVVTRLTVAGTAALAANAVPPTVAEIEAAIPLPAGTPWVALGTMKISRTADTTVTETVDNLYRPSLIPKTVHED